MSTTPETLPYSGTAAAAHVVNLCEMIAHCEDMGDTAGMSEARLALEEVAFGPYCRTHDFFSCPYGGQGHLPCN